jgi:hypothetical protein
VAAARSADRRHRARQLRAADARDREAPAAETAGPATARLVHPADARGARLAPRRGGSRAGPHDRTSGRPPDSTGVGLRRGGPLRLRGADRRRHPGTACAAVRVLPGDGGTRGTFTRARRQPAALSGIRTSDLSGVDGRRAVAGLGSGGRTRRVGGGRERGAADRRRDRRYQVYLLRAARAPVQ